MTWMQFFIILVFLSIIGVNTSKGLADKIIFYIGMVCFSVCAIIEFSILLQPR